MINNIKDRQRNASRRYYKKHHLLCLERMRIYKRKNRTKLNKYRKIYLADKPWWKVYESVYGRCNKKWNASFKYYGARGIQCLLTVSDIKYLWLRDRAYKMERPSIDRVNPKKSYSLSNCRFIELHENLKKRWTDDRRN